MLVLFTDFGWQDPYVGQVKAVLGQQAPGVTIIDLLHSVPDFNAHAGAVMLAAMANRLPVGAVFLCVVDPGVGSDRDALVIEVDGRWFVGPDNGLLSIVAGRGDQVLVARIVWRPEQCSNNFHGRDVFAPVAAALAQGRLPQAWIESLSAPRVQFDLGELPRIVYVDHYGNAWTGIRGGVLETTSSLEVAGQALAYARTFSDVRKGTAFWTVNSVGLVEIAVNRGSAAAQLGLKVGDLVKVSAQPDCRLH